MLRAPSSLGHRAFVMLFAVLAWSVSSAPARAEVQVDLELLLAVDVSASVDPNEYALQAQGLATAFRDPGVREAIRRGGPRGITVAVVQWAGSRDQVVAIDWTHLLDEQSLAAFAARVAAMPRLFIGGDTWLGQAVRFGARAILSNGYFAPRRVIDLSGDGGAEVIGLTKRERDAAVAAGIVINGLAIENNVLDLHLFFRDNLIGGIGAFVMRAGSYIDFAETMRRKLIREIGERPIAGLVVKIKRKSPGQTAESRAA